MAEDRYGNIHGLEIAQLYVHVDDLARIIAAYPGKFVGFGTIGFGNPQRTIAEVDRCITQLGFKGIQLFSNIAGKMLDAAEYRPVLQHIGRMGVPVHLHPAMPLGQAGLDSPGLRCRSGFRTTPA